MPQELRDEIKAMLHSELNLKVPIEEIGDETPLFGPDGLGLDSIDALQISVSLEQKYGVKLANAEAARTAMASVSALHDCVVENRKA